MVTRALGPLALLKGSREGALSLGWPYKWQAAVHWGALIVANLFWLWAATPTVIPVLPLAVCATYVVGMMALRTAVPTLCNRLGERHVGQALVGLVALTVAVQLAGLWLLGPRLDTGMDRDDSLLTWLASFARGEFPYASHTQLGNPISAFPLMPLLAAPFVALGNIGYLEVASYVGLSALLWHRFRGRSTTAALGIVALSSAPLVHLEVILRSELIANVFLLMLLVEALAALKPGDPGGRRVALLGIGLGALMGTRLGFFPALAVVLLFLVRRLGPMRFAQLGAWAAGVFVLIVLPFYLWDPHTFVTYAPLGVNLGKRDISGFAQVAWPVVTGTLMLSGLLARNARDLYLPIAAVMVAVFLGTYTGGFVDVSYFQLAFVPLLFAFPEGRTTA